MQIALYDASIAAFLRGLNNLDAFLAQAQAYAEKKQFDAGNLLVARLAPDMLPFTKQVQIACDSARFSAGRLSGAEVPSHPDDETTLEQLRERIGKTVAFLEGLDKTLFDGPEKTIEMKFKGQTATFTSQDYLLQFALPNFYFHVTTAYAILRHNGVALGKMQYLGFA
ncbi:DUF1993 family protein [Pseudomonas sp. NPDC007930]|uniref:DUF1993 domain-containing protein n=1 Tax=Pseudomonas sp. NPDC007930 TaxID=3364417 RepID=UPI0036F11079